MLQNTFCPIKLTDIENACSEGNIEFITSIVQDKRRWNRKNKNQKTYLDIAIENKQFETVKILIEKGCDINLASQNFDKTTEDILKCILKKFDTNVRHDIARFMDNFILKKRTLIKNLSEEIAKNNKITLNDLIKFIDENKYINDDYPGFLIEEGLLICFCEFHHNDNFSEKYKIIEYLFNNVPNKYISQTSNLATSLATSLNLHNHTQSDYSRLFGLLIKYTKNFENSANVILKAFLELDPSPEYFDIINKIREFLYDNSAYKNLNNLFSATHSEIMHNHNSLLFLHRHGYNFDYDNIKTFIERLSDSYFINVESYMFFVNLKNCHRSIFVGSNTGNQTLPLHKFCNKTRFHWNDDDDRKVNPENSLKLIISHMINVMDVPIDINDEFHNSALYYAVLCKSFNIVKFLIEDCNAVITINVIMCSLKSKEQKIFDFLIQHTKEKLSCEILLNNFLNQNFSIFGNFYYQCPFPMITSILNLMEQSENTIVFDILCRHGLYDFAKKLSPEYVRVGLLSDVCKHPDISFKIYDFHSKLTHWPFMDTINLILKLNPQSINEVCNDNFMTPLHYLCNNPNASTEILELLIENGADIYARDKNLNYCIFYTNSHCKFDNCSHESNCLKKILNREGLSL